MQDPAKTYNQYVIFRLGGEFYAASVQQVREIVVLPEMTRVPNTSDFIAGVMNLRGQIMAVIDLGRRLSLETTETEAPEHIIIVEAEDYTVAMIVDEVPEVSSIPAKAIRETPRLVETDLPEDYIVGIADQKGRLVIVLDLLRILQDHHVEEIRKVEQTSVPGGTKKKAVKKT